MSEKIIAEIDEGIEEIEATFKEGLIIIGGNTMGFYNENTGAIVAGEDKIVEHNLGTTNLFPQLCDLDDQPRGWNTFKPDPSDPTNKWIINVSDDNPNGLILKFIYEIQ